MKTRFLFPHWCKAVGWGFLAVFLVWGVWYLFSPDKSKPILPFLESKMFNLFDGGFVSGANTKGELRVRFSNLHSTIWQVDWNDEVIMIGIILGLILTGFSRLKIEDEFTAQIRLESLQWAMYCHTFLLIICTILIHGSAYWNVMIYSIFTPLIFFVARFHYVLYIKPLFDKRKEEVEV